MLRLTQLFNMTGHPAISLPAGQTSGGLPCGVQLVGCRGQTDALLRVALACERYVTSGLPRSGGAGGCMSGGPAGGGMSGGGTGLMSGGGLSIGSGGRWTSGFEGCSITKRERAKQGPARAGGLPRHDDGSG
jgi:hypothetical protein